MTNTVYDPEPPQKVFFAINGVVMPTPSKFTWIFPKVLGVTGAGKTRYYPFWQLDVTWDYLTFNEYSLLLSTYNGVLSGGINITAPNIWGPNDKVGYVLTGTNRFGGYYFVLLDAPVASDFVDNNYFVNVKMSVRRITLTYGGAPPTNYPNFN